LPADWLKCHERTYGAIVEVEIEVDGELRIRPHANEKKTPEPPLMCPGKGLAIRAPEVVRDDAGANSGIPGDSPQSILTNLPDPGQSKGSKGGTR